MDELAIVGNSESRRPVGVDGLIERREQFLGFVERRVSDRSVAEDILQAAYARVVQKGDALRNEASADAWFYRILRNAIINFYVHRSVEGRMMERLEEGIDRAAPEHGSEPNICPCMDDAVDALRPAYAGILREVDLAGDSAGSRGSLEAFARRSGISPGNAAVRAHRARKALVRQLRHTCGRCAGVGCLDCTCKSAVAAHR